MEPFNAVYNAALDLWASFVWAFLAFRYWWLTEESGPALLLIIRVVCAVAFVAVGTAWQALAKAPIFEKTWTKAEACRFQRLARAVSVGAYAVALYFIIAGILEGERTSSPHRLILANSAYLALALPLSALGYFLRLMFTRKAVGMAKAAVEAGYRAEGV